MCCVMPWLRDVLASIVGGGDLIGQGGSIAIDGDGSAASKAGSGIGGGRGRRRKSGLGASHYRRALADGRKVNAMHLERG